ncbi:MAG: DUF2911 domain-containing protein [Flavobacteriales bacterium]|nr:DUF2911 domain-containing protein [Flavobacteriia bacterium]NCP53115.1 DUF2911 domain-containing protein [Flavobacteriales bacterium]PIV94717.1 MAG: asparagine synthetase B [Flavobacteriaceae bacterium CG17_big_fil_post_rev_8_21_14_2_50_33_15]PIY12275.1 MAG: asparagine synthetase B [Flavobacteriaceae bacterium CG_4_10_14_3_um_filter_33_47]PJB16675.1 MAG: asparagine synthetase B [Flavobacteriaceae bacterium CG_4_9_14_3_um_filter_33_16]
MKKMNLITASLCCLLMLLTFNTNAQDFKGLDKSPMDAASFPSDYNVSNKLIKIVYSRPQLNGRDLATLAPNGKVWRTGANESSELTLYVDMKLGTTTVKAGTYTFYTIPGENKWTAIISKDLNVWGSYFYNESNDVARLSVPVSTGDYLDVFSIAFDEADKGVTMHLGWGTTRVAVPFTK